MAIAVDAAAWASKHERRLQSMGIPSDEAARLRLALSDTHRVVTRNQSLERDVRRLKAIRPKELRRQYTDAQRVVELTKQLLASPGNTILQGIVGRAIHRFELSAGRRTK